MALVLRVTAIVTVVLLALCRLLSNLMANARIPTPPA